MAQITITKKQLVEKVSNKADQTKIKTKEPNKNITFFISHTSPVYL